MVHGASEAAIHVPHGLASVLMCPPTCLSTSRHSTGSNSNDRHSVVAAVLGYQLQRDRVGLLCCCVGSQIRWQESVSPRGEYPVATEYAAECCLGCTRLVQLV